MIGNTLSHYKVIEKIGSGGMGVVYRAEDTTLKREVAIKVLPEQFTKDPQRLARFEREAQLLAQLNHPNIAAIYGLEEADGVRFLSLELVEGETLAERVAKGRLPVEKALEVCRQIAEGMEAAHEKGVIHRDLKPANVKVTPEGKVKILDFGLAKAFEAEIPAADISHSPTLTEEMTRAGAILGTAAYMSPEQARGEEVDKRADIFAYGCVLYELLTGQRAFGGKTVTDTLAKILEATPDWNALPDTTPWRVKELLVDCLTKEAKNRLHDVVSVRIQIQKALKEPSRVLPVGGVSEGQPASWKKAVPWTVAAVSLVLAGIAFWSLTPPTPAVLTELVIAPSPTASVEDLAISPDGRSVVFRAVDEGSHQLYLRSLDDVSTQPIPGTENSLALDFFFSPDSNSLVFSEGIQLKKVSLTGGPPTTICEVVTFRGGSWGAEDIIVFAAASEAGRGLFRVSSNGGEPEVLAIPDPETGEIAYRNPEILPGTQTVLFDISYRGSSDKVAVLSLETGEQKILLEGANAPHYAATGHLIYHAEDTTSEMAVPFDLSRLEVTGGPVSILERTNRGNFDYAFSSEGTLVYMQARDRQRSLVWVDREGVEQLVSEEKGGYRAPRVSPDGKQIVLARTEESSGDNHVLIYDLESDTFRRLTFEGDSNGRPIWSPDGQWITFASNRSDGRRQTYRKRADGTGQTELLVTLPQPSSSGPNSYSPDGSTLTIRVSGDADPSDIWILPMEGDREPQPLITGPNLQRGAEFSPNGRLLAYGSTDTGQYHVYVSPYDEPDVKFLVSGEEGGAEPIWSPDGRELFYRNLNGDQVMVASVETNPTFSAGRPRVLFEGNYYTSDRASGYRYYDISPDGQRFLLIKEESNQGQINVVLNWFEELQRLVPTDN